MKNKIGTVLLFAGLIVVIGGAALLYNFLKDNVETEQLSVEESVNENKNTEDNGEKENEPAELTKAFDFTVYDEEGNAVKLSDFEGKPVVLNFWASWCGPCKSEMPDFEEAYGEYGEEIQFLMVNMTDGTSETIKSATKFIENAGYSFPVYFDTEESALYAYYVYSIPATYFINSDGTLAAYARGMINEEALTKGIGLMK